jgi:hypothetical protein
VRRSECLDYIRTPTEKAETAGDAILNYESHIITALEFVVTRRYSNWDWIGPYSATFVSNKTLYRNPISRQLAVQVRVFSLLFPTYGRFTYVDPVGLLFRYE